MSDLTGREFVLIVTAAIFLGFVLQRLQEWHVAVIRERRESCPECRARAKPEDPRDWLE